MHRAGDRCQFFPDHVVSFGSRANGTAKDDSDADFLAVMDNGTPPAMKAAEIRRTPRVPFRIDGIARLKAEIRELELLGDTFTAEILSSGITLYEATGV